MNDGDMPAVIASAMTVLAAGATVLGFWMRFSDRITKAQAAADNALQEAAEAKKDAADARLALVALDRALGLYRETVAEKYVSREMLRELEQRVTASIDGVRVMAQEGFKSIHGRLDAILGALGDLHAR
jgi:hypothetical protein